jgi:ketosteroid isomerase-like protein
MLGLLSIFSATSASTSTSRSPEQDLIALENAWGTALVKADIPFLEKLYADEYLFTEPTGITSDKAQDIANAKSKDYVITGFKLSDLKVHIYGDTSTVTGRNSLQATFKGEEANGIYRFTDVFVKRNGRWQCVASQATMVAPN